MEFVDGKTVEELLASGVPQRSNMLLSILKKTASALDYAHGKGIIHRDIKPSNIMICPDGTVKIADFGVAKLTASASLTQSGFILGTPSYMSPEQAQGRAIDGRSDQFSLAVVAYRMLSGKLPFEGPTLTALLAKILWEEPAYEEAGLIPPVQPVFKRALSKDPQPRYPNCGEFVRELEDAYARSKAEAFKAIPLMTEQSAAPADSKAVLPGYDSAAEIPVALEAAEPVRESAPQPASSIMPATDTPVTREDKESSRSSTSVLPEIPAHAPKRRSMLIAWAAGLGIVVLAVIAFLLIKAIQKPVPSVQKASPDIVTALKNDAAEIAPPSEPLSPSEKQEGDVAPQPSSAQPDLDKIVAPEIPAPKPKRVQPSASQLHPTSGVMTWSGELAKNSILVITGQESTIGSVVGQLPGKPVKIEVEPEDLVLRQMPGKINGWNQIILYSGNQKYSSITIRWQTVK